MTTRIATALLAAVLFLQPLPVAADESHSLEQLVIEMANTPAEHAAVAKHFRSRAADARALAAEHEAMGKSYSGGKLSERMQMQSHCKKLAEQYNAVAAQYDELAKLEEAEAKRTP